MDETAGMLKDDRKKYFESFTISYYRKIMMKVERNLIKNLLHTYYTLVKTTSKTLINTGVLVMSTIEWE